MPSGVVVRPPGWDAVLSHGYPLPTQRLIYPLPLSSPLLNIAPLLVKSLILRQNEPQCFNRKMKVLTKTITTYHVWNGVKQVRSI